MSNITYPNTSNQQQQQVPQVQYQTPQQHAVPIPQQPYYYSVNTPLIQKDLCKDDKHKSDRAFSVTFFVIGIFLFFPLFFNFAYLKSPHFYARKISLVSLIVGTFYLCAGVINFSIFYLGMKCWNGYYYDFC